MTRDEIDDLVFRVYCARIDQECDHGTSTKMIERDEDGGVRQRRRSLFYRPVITETLVQLGLCKRPLPAPRRAQMGVT